MSLISEQYSHLRPYPPRYPTYPPYSDVSQYLEHYFYNYYLNNIDSFSSCERQYIPVYWTTVYNDRVNLPEVYNTLLALDKRGKYFTVNQHDNGIQFPLPEDTLVFSASEVGAGKIVPIPLITSPLLGLPEVLPEKDILCSFVGTLTHPIRHQLYKELKYENNFYFTEPRPWSANITKEHLEEFKNVTYRSKFGLAPRGNIIQSFRVYEIIQLNCVPVIVSDAFYPPFCHLIDWSSFSLFVKPEDIPQLPAILEGVSDDVYYSMLRKGKEVYSEYFTLQGMSSTIRAMLCD